MKGPILYIDISEVVEGKLPELKTAIDELINFINTSIPRVIFYSIYLSNDNKYMTVAQMHPDSASLEYQMETGMPVFAKFKSLLKLKSIDIYGKPSDNLLVQLDYKAKLLGGAVLNIHELQGSVNKF